MIDHMPSVLDDSGVAADVARHLRDGIRTGRLAPGDRIVERAIAEEIGASSIAVRDAFARLSQEGWIERLPRRGVRVRRLDTAEVDEISRLRALLEGEAAALASTAPPTDDLRALADEMAIAARASDRDRLVALDDAFHRLIWRTTAAPTLEELLANLRNRIAPLVHRSLATMTETDLAAMRAWHLDLAEALTRGAEPARAAAADHAERTRTRVRTTIDPNSTPQTKEP